MNFADQIPSRDITSFNSYCAQTISNEERKYKKIQATLLFHTSVHHQETSTMTDVLTPNNRPVLHCVLQLRHEQSVNCAHA